MSNKPYSRIARTNFCTLISPLAADDKRVAVTRILQDADAILIRNFR